MLGGELCLLSLSALAASPSAVACCHRTVSGAVLPPTEHPPDWAAMQRLWDDEPSVPILAPVLLDAVDQHPYTRAALSSERTAFVIELGQRLINAQHRQAQHWQQVASVLRQGLRKAEAYLNSIDSWLRPGSYDSMLMLQREQRLQHEMADLRQELGRAADREAELRQQIEQQRRHITHCYQEERRHFSRANTLMQQLQDMQQTIDQLAQQLGFVSPEQQQQ